MSHHDEPVPEGKDPALWEVAQNRASFKSHLVTYLIVNSFMWGIWFFSGKHDDVEDFPWPAWTSLCWGIGVAFHFASAYVFHKQAFVEDEYQKLLNQKNRQQ